MYEKDIKETQYKPMETTVHLMLKLQDLDEVLTGIAYDT